jgi:hypothetical protein
MIKKKTEAKKNKNRYENKNTHCLNILIMMDDNNDFVFGLVVIKKKVFLYTLVSLMLLSNFFFAIPFKISFFSCFCIHKIDENHDGCGSIPFQMNMIIGKIYSFKESRLLAI